MKLSPPTPVKTSTAFTLIELLVVIAIITVLMGLLFPAFSSVKEAAKKAQAKNDETQIVTAVKQYYSEYGKYPVTSGTTDITFGVSPTNDVLFDVLRNNTASAANGAVVAQLNPRQIAFLEVPTVKNQAQPVSGVMPNNAAQNQGVWYDPWGSPYNVIIDADYNNSITNPYSDAPGGTTLATGVIVIAYGKNGVLGGGPASNSAKFSKEPGSGGKSVNSGDVISWQ